MGSSNNQDYIQCVCGRVIKDPSEYKLLYLRKEDNEIDILCPNDTCYLRELGYIKFEVIDNKPKVVKASFYTPFVTWNVARLGKEKAMSILKNHLRALVKIHVHWDKIMAGAEGTV